MTGWAADRFGAKGLRSGMLMPPGMTIMTSLRDRTGWAG
jgi:hypothetical protein